MGDKSKSKKKDTLGDKAARTGWGRAVRSKQGEGWQALLRGTRNKFLAGVAVGVPLFGTIWLVFLAFTFIFNYISQPVMARVMSFVNLVAKPFRVGQPGEAIDPLTMGPFLSNVLGVLLLFLILIGLGVMATNVIGVRFLSAVDRILLNLPIISIIYKAFKQFIDSVKGFGGSGAGGAQNFKRVAWVEYPSPGSRLIGFVTSQFYDRQIQKDVTAIFVPTSPNPMTGFVVVVEDRLVLDCDMSMEEATKMIFSAGLVNPGNGGGAPSPESVETLKVKDEPQSFSDTQRHRIKDLPTAEED